MSIFKRLSATLVSRIDQVVGEIENHEAVIQASLSDMRKKIAEAKVSLNRVRAEEQQAQKQREQYRENAELWRQRVIECATEDEHKALECLSRRRLCKQKTETLRKTLDQYRITIDKLAEDIETSEQRLNETKQKLSLMRARQSTSQALSATAKANEHTDSLLEDSFERWEININETALSIDTLDTSDSLERDFLTKEKQQDLRNELTALLEQEEQK